MAGFNGCSVNTEGTYALGATDADDALTATSSPFDVGSGVPSHLVFTSEPAGAAGGTAFSTQPTVTIEDAGGNTITSRHQRRYLGADGGRRHPLGLHVDNGRRVAAFSGCSIDTAASGDS